MSLYPARHELYWKTNRDHVSNWERARTQLDQKVQVDVIPLSAEIFHYKSHSVFFFGFCLSKVHTFFLHQIKAPRPLIDATQS